MKVGDIERTTKGRYFLNTWLVPRVVNLLNNGDEVLFVGIETNWNYKPFFWNPGKQCPYFTLDINEGLKPDIVCNIEDCRGKIASNRFSLVIMIGMYEFLDSPSKAFREIRRILKPNKYMLIALPGKGYYSDHRGVSLCDISSVIHQFRVLEMYCIYEGKEEPNSICVLCQKK